MNGKPLPESKSFCLLGLPFDISLSWCQYIEGIAKAASKKIGSFYQAERFITAESILYLHKSTICPCFEYCCHILAGAQISSLNLLDWVQRWPQYLVGNNHFSKFQSLSHRRGVASLLKYRSSNSSIPTHRYFRNHNTILSATKKHFGLF